MVLFQLKHAISLERLWGACENMVVSVVELAADAYLTCLTHALTTEKEEVMGLLLGEVSSVQNFT